MAAKNTSLARVYNPARTVKAGASRSTNPVKKTKKRRTNPTTKRVVNAASHRRRRSTRRRNPAGMMGLLTAMLVTGGGIFLFDVLVKRFLPTQGALAGAGIKLGGAFLMQSSVGAKVPVLGKYKNEIALVLGAWGVADLLAVYVLPTFNQVTNGFFSPSAVPVQQIPAGEMGDDYLVVEELDDEGDDDEGDDFD